MAKTITTQLFTDTALLAAIEKFSRFKSFEKDTVLMNSGDDIVFVPIVQTGVLRIIRQNDDGDEVFLYHLYAGETCALSVNCSQTHKRSMVKAVAEDATDVVLIPVQQVEDWMRFPQWKSFIDQAYARRFGELIEVIDLVSFSNMDTQVTHYLQERSKAINSNILNITHQQIADELHTHREVISRLLRQMEQKNLIGLGRNAITLKKELFSQS